jgi:hypothetical protein
MTRHYSTKHFLRQMPNALLARYFNARRLFGDLDFSTMKEGRPDALFEAWLALPDAQRNPMEAEFHEIFDMGCRKGFMAIIDAARWQLRETPENLTSFVAMLSGLPGYFDRAMITFLDFGHFWKGATRFYHADTLSYWRKRKNLPKQPAVVDDASIQELACSIGNYFHHTEGRGKNCLVEHYQRGELDYLFCYPEDHSQHSIEWIDGKFQPRTHNPVFEIVYVYSQKEGRLDLNFRGSYRAVVPLQEMFANAILKFKERLPDPKDQRVYDLNPLRQKSFSLTWPVGSGIQSVIVKKLRLSSRVSKGERVTVEADPSQDEGGVYALLDRIGKSEPLDLYDVTQVELAASVVVDTDEPSKTVTIRIAHPNSCSLRYDEVDLKLRDMLVASGVEPKERRRSRRFGSVAA